MILLGIYFLVLGILFVWDLRLMVLPDFLTLPLILGGLGLAWMGGRFEGHFLAALAGFLTFFIINFFGKLVYKRDVMGGGDMKLAAGIGAWWGAWHLYLCISAAFILGGVVGLGLLSLGKKDRSSLIPFGPFLIAGSCFAYFYI